MPEQIGKVMIPTQAYRDEGTSYHYAPASRQKWDARRKEGQTKGTQHDAGHFDIALEMARYVAE